MAYRYTILDLVHYPQETISDLYISSNFFVKSNTQATTHPHKQHSNDTQHTPTSKYSNPSTNQAHPKPTLKHSTVDP